MRWFSGYTQETTNDCIDIETTVLCGEINAKARENEMARTSSPRDSLEVKRVATRAIKTSERIARDLARATEAAAQVQQQRDAERRRRKEEQAEREDQLDKILANVANGLLAILDLAAGPDIVELTSARAAIGQDTYLYALRAETFVGVSLHPKGVELVISGERVSPAQGVGKPTSYDSCAIRRLFTFGQVPPIGWFWNLFHADLTRHWYEFEFTDENAYPSMPTRRNPVGARALEAFAHSDPIALEAAAAELEVYEWEPSFILMRVLADCNDARKLKRYFRRALKSMK